METKVENTKRKDEDLSAQIIGLVEKMPDDIVRCIHVGGSRYRCNWWTADTVQPQDNPTMAAGQIGTTHRIRQSQFMDVVRTETGLRVSATRQQ